MSRWLRYYIGTARDPKFVGLAARIGQPLERIVWIWLCILESAADRRAGGAYRLDPHEAAYMLRCKPLDITMILAGLEKDELVAGGAVVKWPDRQFEDAHAGDVAADAELSAAAKRMRRFRSNKRNGVTPGDVTGVTRSVTVTPPESESSTESKNHTATRRAKPAKPSGQIPLLLPVDGGGAGAMPKPDLDTLELKLREAAGGSLNAVSTGLMILSDPLSWLEKGCDLEGDILPTLRAVAARPGTRPGAVRTWNFFTGAVFEARDRRQTGPPASASPIVIDIASNHLHGDRDEQRRQPASQAERAVKAMAAAHKNRVGDGR